MTGLTAAGDRLTITLEAPAPDFLHRLAMSFACPVPANTPALRSGLNAEPPIGGAGPYYLAQKIAKRLVVLLKNPNYHGPRAQPFDAIAIKVRHGAGRRDRARSRAARSMPRCSTAASRSRDRPARSPRNGAPAARTRLQGDQRWFGATSPRGGLHRPEPDATGVPRTSTFAGPWHLPWIRAAISSIWVTAPTAGLLVPSVPGSAGPDARAVPRISTLRCALMQGRTFDVTMMGFPTEWGCGACRDFEVAVTGQLKAIGITVTVRHPRRLSGGCLEPGSDIDLLNLGTGTDLPGPGRPDRRPSARTPGSAKRTWTSCIGSRGSAARHASMAPSRSPIGSSTRRRSSLPTGYPVFPFFISERIGCGFVQPAIGAVDLLSLCIKAGAATPTSSASPAP